MPTPFHLAIRVLDLPSARAFYGDLLGCPERCSSGEWVDFDFFGHQLVCHAGADAGGKALEFKAFRDIAGQLFAR